MELLVTYDVATDTQEGRRRLRHVADVCEAHGQRVQKSVFECILDAKGLELLRHRLLKEVDQEQDSLRIYVLKEPRQRYLQVIGRQPEFDLHDPLVF
ncbi:MAG: CRISPR-associated endonuclease Cas2 [Dehalococcoidales bacterium]|nr:CRISPR-associated endonuclease Cas2 [Dehalococcoidales bacterium]